jgi:small subunit ribosomal protein S20
LKNILLKKIKNSKMNKKQKNRKLISQNKRNRMINRRYLSTIKTLSKLIKIQKKQDAEKTDLSIFPQTGNKIQKNEKHQKLINSFYSIVDKAVKKKVIHKNTAARKKSKLSK